MRTFNKQGVIIFLMTGCLLLTGCAATQTAISKRNLKVQTKLSDTVFLDPVLDRQKTIYLQFKNTSDRRDFSIKKTVAEGLQAAGYRLVGSSPKAHYLLQANILQVGKADPAAAEKIMLGGYSGAISGASFGATLGALSGGNGRSLLAGGLIGSVAGTVANSLVKDVTYSVITDIQLSERTPQAIEERIQSHLKQGSATTQAQRYRQTTHWKRYRTRILSTAERVNLSFKEAKPALKEGLTRAIVGLF